MKKLLKIKKYNISNMAKLGKKKRKKKKRGITILIKERGLGGKAFTQSSFKESEKFSLVSLTKALQDLESTRQARIDDVATRRPELDLESVRYSTVAPLRGVGAFRVREDGEDDDRTVSLSENLPTASIVATAPVITDRQLPRYRPRQVDDPDETTVTSGQSSSLGDSSIERGQRWFVDPEGNIEEIDDYSAGFRGSLASRPSTQSSLSGGSIFDPNQRRYQRENMGFWSGQAIKNFAAARGVTVGPGVTLRQGTPEREEVLDALFEGSRPRGIL